MNPGNVLEIQSLGMRESTHNVLSSMIESRARFLGVNYELFTISEDIKDPYGRVTITVIFGLE
ncbi:MAG: hypothetical protein ACI9DM_000247 [Cyclobacteriaceae bacterium]|jgi:hypothetical protein